MKSFAKSEGTLHLHGILIVLPVILFAISAGGDVAYLISGEIVWIDFSLYTIMFGLCSLGIGLSYEIAERLMFHEHHSEYSVGRYWALNFLIVCLFCLDLLARTGEPEMVTIPFLLSLAGTMGIGFTTRQLLVRHNLSHRTRTTTPWHQRHPKIQFHGR